MATVNALSVALFNAAAGGYAAEMTANPSGFANAVGPILEKDVSTDALFVDHLLGNLGVTSSNDVYAQAKAAVAALVTTNGRAGAAADAVDFLKAQEGSTSAYATIAANFAAKVNAAAAFTAANSTERDITKLISGVTGVDTDAAAIAAATAAVEAAAATAAAAAATKAAADLAAANAAAEAAATAAAAALAAAEAEAAADLAAANAAAEAAAAAATAAAEAAAAKAAADLAAANATITSLQNPAGGSFALTTSTEEKFGTAGNDTFTATSSTYGSNDIVVDGTATDNDTLNITATADISATTLVVGIENVNITTTQALSSGDTTLSVAVDNIRGGTVTFDVDNTDSLIDTLAITSARSGPTYVANSDFSTVSASIIADADVTLNVKGTSVSLSTTAVSGTPDDLTVIATNNVTITSSASTEDLVVTAGGDATITANSILGNVTVTAGDDVSVTATAALGNVVVTTTGASNADVTLADVSAAEGDITVITKGTITVTTATAAEGTLTLNNTGADAGDDILVTNANSVTAAVITSVGAITATDNNGLADVETLTATAGESSAITVNTDAVGGQTITLNGANVDGDEIVFTLVTDAADDLELAIGGATAVEVAIEGNDLSGATVTTSNAAGAAVLVANTANGNVDVTEVAGAVKIRIGGDFNSDTFTIASGQTFYFDDADAVQGGVVTFDHETNATSSTSLSTTIATYDSATTAGNIAEVAGIAVTDIQTLNINLASGVALDSTADITGADLLTVVVTGSGALDLNGNTITGNSTTNVVLNASALTGVVTMSVDGTASGVETVTTGSAADVITIGAAAASGNAFTITTGAGTDTVIFSAASDAVINGGSGTDKVRLAAALDLSTSELTFTSVEQIELVGGAGSAQSVSAAWISGKTFILAENGTGTATLNVVMDQLTVDLSNLAAASSFASGTDTITIDASGLGVGATITGSGSDDIVTGTVSADTISTGGGADVINGGRGADDITTGAGSDTVVMGATRNGNDTINGFTVGSGSSADIIRLDLSGLEEDAAGNADVDLINIDLGTSSVASSDTVVLSTVTGAFNADTLTTDTLILVANLSSNIASASALETALEDAGDLELTADGAITAKDGFLVLFDNGTNSFLAHVESAAGASDNGTFAAGDLTATVIATFVGVSDVTTLVAANFSLVG